MKPLTDSECKRIDELSTRYRDEGLSIQEARSKALKKWKKSVSKRSTGACDSGEGNSSDSSSNNSSSEEDDPADESRRRRLRKFARKKDMMALLSRNKCYAGREGQDSFDAWITQFERVMGPGWPSSEKVTYLVARLTGDALKAYMSFQKANPLEANNYEKLKDHLRERFHGGETREEYVNKFDESDQNPGESLISYAARLEEYYNYAFPAAVGDQGVRYDALKRRFLKGIDSELKIQIRFLKADNFKEFVKLAVMHNVGLKEKEKPRKVEFVRAAQEEYSKIDALTDAISDFVTLQTASVNAVTQTLKPNPLLPIQQQQHLLEASEGGLTAQVAELTQQVANLQGYLGAKGLARKAADAYVAEEPKFSHFTSRDDGPGSASRVSPIVCYKCNQAGHKKDRCPLNAQLGAPPVAHPFLHQQARPRLNYQQQPFQHGTQQPQYFAPRNQGKPSRVQGPQTGPPPYPCKRCGIMGIVAWHWHSDCPASQQQPQPQAQIPYMPGPHMQQMNHQASPQGNNPNSQGNA